MHVMKFVVVGRIFTISFIRSQIWNIFALGSVVNFNNELWPLLLSAANDCFPVLDKTGRYCQEIRDQ